MNPRQLLKSLNTLARARDLELNDLRRAAAAIHEKLARLDAIVESLNATIRDEGAAAGGDPTRLTVYAEFSAGARRRIQMLKDARHTLEAQAVEADARVLEGFRALKQIEEAAEAKRGEIDHEIAVKEQAEADDIALQRAARNA